MSAATDPKQITMDPLSPELRQLRQLIANQGNFAAQAGQRQNPTPIPASFAQLYSGPMTQSYMSQPQQPPSLFSNLLMMLANRSNTGGAGGGGAGGGGTGGNNSQSPQMPAQQNPQQPQRYNGGAPPSQSQGFTPPAGGMGPGSTNYQVGIGNLSGWDQMKQQLETAISGSGHSGAITPYMLYRAGVAAGVDPNYMAANTAQYATDGWFAGDRDLIQRAAAGEQVQDPYGNVGMMNDAWRQKMMPWAEITKPTTGYPVDTPQGETASNDATKKVVNSDVRSITGIGGGGGSSSSVLSGGSSGVPMIGSSSVPLGGSSGVPLDSGTIPINEIANIIKAAPQITSGSRYINSINSEMNPEGVMRKKELY